MRSLFLAALVAIPLTVVSQGTARIGKTAVLLRESPNGRQLMHLPYGTKLDIISSKGPWCQVEVSPNIAKGYVHESMLALGKLEKTRSDAGKITALRLWETDFEDSYVTWEDASPDPYNPVMCPNIFKDHNEGMERMLYWEDPKPASKHYLYAFDVLAERIKEGIYQATPCEIFNQSKIYQLPNETYNSEVRAKPARKFAKPEITASFFNSLPENYLVADVDREEGGRLFFYGSSPMLIHLLRTYFKDGNSFKLEKENGKLVHASSQKITFLSTDEKGGNLQENTGQVKYFPGVFGGGSCIANLGKAHPKNNKFLYFTADKSLMQKLLENTITIAPQKNYDSNIDVVEFDFDSDGVVDMLRSMECCPEEAGDSCDEVYYFNVNGKWKAVLATRSWCNP